MKATLQLLHCLLALRWLFTRRVRFANISLENAMLGEGGAFNVQQPDTMFVPFGDYPHKKGTQRFNAEAARELANNFNSVPARLKRWLSDGAPTYIGHPDVPELRHLYNDSKAYGWITSVTIKDTGAEFGVKWSDEGRKLVANAHYKYYSPYWEATPAGGNLYRPVQLISFGLTNTPNIPVPALANDVTTTTFGRAQWNGLLGLPEDADDNAFGNALKALHENHGAMKAELEGARQAKSGAEAAQQSAEAEKAAAEKAKATAESEKEAVANDLAAARADAKAAREARIGIELQRLEREGRILPSATATHHDQLMGMANEAAVTTEIDRLNKLPGKVKTQSQVQGAAGQKSAVIQGAAEGQRAAALANAVQEELAELKKTVSDPQAAYNIAWERVAKKQPGLFANG